MRTDTHPYRAAALSDARRAERAVEALLEAGFPADHVSWVAASEELPERDDEVEVSPPASHDAPQVAAAGGTLGGLLGGLTLAAGVVASGGTGLLVVGSLLGGGATGALAGSLVGAMTARGFEPDVADFYDRAVRRGAHLVAVEWGEGTPPPERAEEIFQRCGAEPLELA